ncbi:hypothetical protein ILUMI_19858 [Ignelater luminosus]|uniref:Thioredoxin domain-containing protein n=1 Tax=Ignelater luminosus TaxID=2038154 RepID=A0A8K0CM43_IGNLU|nr:hypothetical protein ILUMI_19858 [Ignelater luminosus]
MDNLSIVTGIRNIMITYILVAYVFCNPTDGGALQLTQQNLNLTLASNELVFTIFYAEWDIYSNAALPLFDEAANKIREEYPETGKVVLAKLNCEKEESIATRFHIENFPTFKIIKNGQPAKRQYLGQRTTEAFVSFVKKELEDPVKELAEPNLETDKKTIIGYFDMRHQLQYNIFRKVANNLKDDCQFYARFGNVSKQMDQPEESAVVFFPDKLRSNDSDESYNGTLNNFDEFYIWASNKCVPLVRELTFDNTRELMDEELPFLILFYNPDDKTIIETYNEVIQKELLSEKDSINFLTADGNTHARSLLKLGKSKDDLPLIAIDTFIHMYLFPNTTDIEIQGKLKQFIHDLHLGPDSERSGTPAISFFKSSYFSIIIIIHACLFMYNLL